MSGSVAKDWWDKIKNVDKKLSNKLHVCVCVCVGFCGFQPIDKFFQIFLSSFLSFLVPFINTCILSHFLFYEKCFFTILTIGALLHNYEQFQPPSSASQPLPPWGKE